MPNIKSAKKRVLVTSKKADQNKAVKTNLKTVMKKAISGDASAIQVAIKKVDQAAAKNILHKNTASRRKSALMKKLNAAAQ